MKFKVTVQYDGSSFLGWQKQNNERTVQEDIEKALYRISKVKIPIHGSGRTDAGVHALSQVFHFESDLKMNAHNWLQAINSTLAKDIYVLSVVQVKEDFHARYHAISKSYEYRLNMGMYDPFNRNYEYQYNRNLDVAAMKSVLPVFIGTHDFTSFNATELTVVTDQIRILDSFEIDQVGEHLIFSITGNGFLRYMVRMLVAACVEVGKGKKTPDDIKNILELKDKRAFARNIDARGLYLLKVSYDDGWEFDETI